MANNVSVVVSAETSAVNSGLKSASNAVDSFKKSSIGSFSALKGALAGVFAVGAIQQGVSSILDEFGRIKDLADRFGESTATMQRVGYAAKQSGTDLETVAKAMQKVNGNALDAVSGNEQLQGAFATLGLNAATFVDLPMEEKLTLLAKGFAEGGSNAETMDAIIAVLGKSGGDLIPLLQGGADSLKAMFNEAAVAGDESVAKLAEAGDKIDKTFSNLKAAGATALAFLITKAEELWAGLNSVGVYLANLPDGFKAAAEAAAQFQQEFMDSRKKEDKGDENKKRTDIAKLQAAAEKAANKDSKDKSAKEAEAAAKEEAKAKEKAADEAFKAELEDMKRVAKEAERLSKESQKSLEDAKQQTLDDAAGNLATAERGNRGIPVDSLRRIGANFGQGEANSVSSQAGQMQKQVDIARQQLEYLKKLYEKAGNANSSVNVGSSYGGFTE